MNDKLFSLIEEIYKDKSKLNLISQNQTQYSDKNVYNNINQVLKKIIHEKINLGQSEVIHFVGIGGIGMSGLAQIMKNMGFNIQGSDQFKNKNTVACIKVALKYLMVIQKNIKSSTILVRSSAIKNTNSEIKYAKKIPIYSRAEV